MRSFFLFIFFLFGGVFFAHGASALTISPARQTAIVDAGANQTLKLQVTNEDKETIEVKGSVDAFKIEENSHRPIFGNTDEAVSWIQISPRSLTLKPNETKEITFVVRPPKTAIPQAHYLGLFAEVKPKSGQVGVSSRVGSLLFFYVAGDLTEQMDLVDFSSGSKWYQKNTAELFLRAQNKGTIHVIPFGVMTARNWRGKVVAQIPLNGEQRIVLPQTTWKVEQKLGLRLADIGKINVETTVQYGINQKIIQADTFFWYLPVWVLVGGLVSLVVFCFVIFRLKRILAKK